MLCAACKNQMFYESGSLRLQFSPKTNPTLRPVHERFAELFRAARTLLKRETEATEDIIIPTLWMAYEIAQGSKYWTAIREEAVRGNISRLREIKVEDGVRRSEGPRSIRVVKVVDDVPLLQKQPVFAEPVMSHGLSDGPTHSLSVRWKVTPTSEATVVPDLDFESWGGVLLRVYPRKGGAKTEEEVAYQYEEVLKDEGISYGRSRETLIEYELTGHCLYLLVTPGKRGRASSNRRRFPSPSLVSAFYSGISKEFGERLMTRRAGGQMMADNLIPACVAFLLRSSGAAANRTQVHRLLNEHVFCGSWKSLPEAGWNDAEVVRLWRDVKKAHKQIAQTISQF